MSIRCRKFVMIERKTFDLVNEGEDLKCLRISENSWGFRASIPREKEEFEWLLDSLEDFYWRKGQDFWRRSKVGHGSRFGIVLGWNRRGRFLILSEVRGKYAKQIIIPDGLEEGGWWEIMRFAFELAEKVHQSGREGKENGGKRLQGSDDRQD